MTSKTILTLATFLALCGSAVLADHEGDPERGKRLFAQCGSCHSLEPEGGPVLGPNLHDLFGRKAGSVPGFDYSEAMKTSDITWGAEEIDEFIKQPFVFLPGNKMLFMGIEKDQQRADIIAYLREATR